MDLYAIIDQVAELLRQRGRLTYRALKLQFQLDAEQLAALREELIDGQRIAADEDDKVLVWMGKEPSAGSREQRAGQGKENSVNTHQLSTVPRAEGERRQLTVMFCDLVGSTALSAHLDPEDYRAVVQAYHATGAAVIEQYQGHLAQHLGDGLLVYFGYPVAHEDDAHRAVRAGLDILTALKAGTGQAGAGTAAALPVRIGIHTGLVVVGDIGTPGRTEHLALGETPNLAARIQGLAEPNTVIISAATQRLIDGQFECQPFGSHLVKGITTPIAVYHVQSERQQVSPLAGKIILTPLVGRDQEVGLLLDRWEQVKEGRGHVVLLSGEPGIGKSRLAHTLKEQVTAEGSLLYEARCSPYHQQSALYPLIDMLQRTVLLTRHDTDPEKVAKLEQVLALYELQDALPLLTALLSLPTPAQYPPLTFTPQKQKERTLQALLRVLMAQAERQATVLVWEDVHWADPSSLEFLTVLIEQMPTTKLLLVLTSRPEFTPPWKPRSHLSHLVLNRLGQKHVETMIAQAVPERALSPEVIEQIRLKTDGVPLFVEELTKSVVEHLGDQATGNGQWDGQTERQRVAPSQLLSIPATLQDALMARLDRLADARQIAQLGATLGREFSYELLHAVAPVNETDVQAALTKLMEAEILYQRGNGEQARYVFKHALIQDTAYQSLLKSTRQQYHQQIAHVLEERFPDTKANQPELLARHYTEAGQIEQAIPYWQQAGQRATQHSANLEALTHLTTGLELLETVPDTPERAQQELALQLAQSGPLMATKGPASPEVEQAYARALSLCRQIGETPQLFPVLVGLRIFYTTRGELQTACELGEQLLRLAQRVHDPALLGEAHIALGAPLNVLGELVLAREHFEQGIALCDLRQQRASIYRYGADIGVIARSPLAQLLWVLGYPNQARECSREALTRAQAVNLPFSTAVAWNLNTVLLQFLHEPPAIQQRSEALRRLCHEQGLSGYFAGAIVSYGWALAMQGQTEEGIQEIQQGLAAVRDTGTELYRPYYLALLAEAYRKTGQVEEGLTALVEALAVVEKTRERWYEAELYRLKGELILQNQSGVRGPESEAPNPQYPTPSTQVAVEQEAEECFSKAIAIAQKQQAKSLELRAVMSLARLWQSYGKTTEAHKLLSDIYQWFAEGFDTKDLQEAKALLEELV